MFRAPILRKRSSWSSAFVFPSRLCVSIRILHQLDALHSLLGQACFRRDGLRQQIGPVVPVNRSCFDVFDYAQESLGLFDACGDSRRKWCFVYGQRCFVWLAESLVNISFVKVWLVQCRYIDGCHVVFAMRLTQSPPLFAVASPVPWLRDSVSKMSQRPVPRLEGSTLYRPDTTRSALSKGI